MTNSTGVPDYLRDIPDGFLPYKIVASTGPLIIVVEKAAIQFDPPGTGPGSEAEWETVANAIGKIIEPQAADLAARHDIIRVSEAGSWHHLTLTAELLAQEGIRLRTDAHWVHRQNKA
jgi:hypothetical protein